MQLLQSAAAQARQEVRAAGPPGHQWKLPLPQASASLQAHQVYPLQTSHCHSVDIPYRWGGIPSSAGKQVPTGTCAVSCPEHQVATPAHLHGFPSTAASSCLRCSEGCRHGAHALGPALQDSALSHSRSAQSSWQPECSRCCWPALQSSCSLPQGLPCLPASQLFRNVCSTDLAAVEAALAAGDGKDLQIDAATLDRVTKAMLSRTEAVLLTKADRREAR